MQIPCNAKVQHRNKSQKEKRSGSICISACPQPDYSIGISYDPALIRELLFQDVSVIDPPPQSKWCKIDSDKLVAELLRQISDRITSYIYFCRWPNGDRIFVAPWPKFPWPISCRWPNGDRIFGWVWPNGARIFVCGKSCILCVIPKLLKLGHTILFFRSQHFVFRSH